MRGLCCYVWALSSCSEQGLLSSYGRAGPVSTGPRTAAPAQLPHSTWGLPDQALDSHLLHWQADSEPLDHQGSCHLSFRYDVPSLGFRYH